MRVNAFAITLSFLSLAGAGMTEEIGCVGESNRSPLMAWPSAASTIVGTLEARHDYDLPPSSIIIPIDPLSTARSADSPNPSIPIPVGQEPKHQVLQVVDVIAPTSVTTTSQLLNPPTTEDVFITTQWIETWIGGTSQTWVPKTITLHFDPHITQGPSPGKGDIGMGTLTGKTGKTQVVVMAGAPVQSGGYFKGIGVAMGVGLAGMMV